MSNLLEPENDHTSDVRSVPQLDLKAQFERLKPEIMAAIEAVCDEQRFILGPRVLALEEKVAAYCGAEHGIGVSSGTDALLVALMALEIGVGHEVITPPFTFFATAGTISRTGARPVFCDIEPGTFNLDSGAVEAFLQDTCERRGGGLFNRETGAQIKAIMPVHLFGQVAEIARLAEIAKEYGLYVIEDAAQAIGSEDSARRRAGSFGDIGCLSFFPSKNLGAFGDAGMCVTNDPEMDDRVRLLRSHGARPKYRHAVIGGNFRLDEIQAAVLLVKFRFLDSWSEARRRNAAIYTDLFGGEALTNQITLPKATSGARHIYNQYVIRARDRDGLRASLADAGISTEIYYPQPMHLQACYADFGMGRADFPESVRAAEEALALPIYPELTEAQQRYVVAEIARYYA